jgi:hypothetical protein
MKKPLVMTLLLLCSTFYFAQKAREFGLKFSDIDSYGLVFTTGKKDALTGFPFLSVTNSNSIYENSDGTIRTTESSGRSGGFNSSSTSITIAYRLFKDEKE